MFNWLKKKEETPKEATLAPDKPENDKPGVTYYRLGITDNHRVSLQMGYSEISMNPQGVQNLIDQLELFKEQIIDFHRVESKDEVEDGKS